MKNQKQQAVPEFTTDAEGQQLVHVALANTKQKAILYAEDYRRLMDAGFSSNWQNTGTKGGNAYPTVSAYTGKGVDCLVPIARLIAQAEAGQVVRYRDANSTNLRRENLKVEAGIARFGAADWYPNTAALRAAGITPKSEEWREGSRPPMKPRKPRSAPVRPTGNQQTPSPVTTRQLFTPRTVNTAALGQRVREQVASKGISGGAL